MTQYPVPYKYIVTLRSRRETTPGLRCFVMAWTAEDACVQIEVQYEIRGNPKPEWRVTAVDPWVDPGPRKLSDEAVVAKDT